MAESVDALVSNTSGAIRAGSTPALGTELRILVLRVLFSILAMTHFPVVRFLRMCGDRVF